MLLTIYNKTSQMSIYATPTPIAQTIETNRLYEKVDQSLARWKKRDKKIQITNIRN